MSKPLVIVESPAKVKTISKILGPDYTVASSVGHIRDLPRSKKDVPIDLVDKCEWNAVLVDEGFNNIYVVPENRKDIVKKLKKLVPTASELYLATDDDREGEAIAWHLEELLEYKNKPKRITFNEITESAIKKAIENPGVVDLAKVKSWEARRTLDRMIGFELTPIMRNIGGGSTGRVKIPSVKLIVETERERFNYIESEYFEITAECHSSNYSFSASVKSIQEKKLASASDFDEKGNRQDIKKKYLESSEAKEIVTILSGSKVSISNIKESPRTGKPPKPLKTTSLQSAARNKLGFQPSRTMAVAQKLYNEGFITYMRTDSIRLSENAIKASRNYISSNFSKDFLPAEPRVFTDNKDSQGAHEAIRPSGEEFKSPDEISNKFKVDSDEHNLYSLIFNTTIASQMSNAKGITKTVEIEINDEKFGPIVLGVSGTTWTFEGYRRVLGNLGDTTQSLPDLKKGEEVNISVANAEEKYTNPPNRYSSVGLIKKLEELGIGRPSTYVEILKGIGVNFIRSESSLFPRMLAIVKIENLIEPHFPKYADYKYTRYMEEGLDGIAKSSNPQKAHLEFLNEAYKEIKLHIQEFKDSEAEPEQLTTVNLGKTIPDNIKIKAGPIRDGIPFPYLIQDDKEIASLSIDITIEEIDEELVTSSFLKKKEQRKLEREIGKCSKCENFIYIKLGMDDGVYILHGEENKKRCVYKKITGMIFEDEDSNSISLEQALERFNHSPKNPREISTDDDGWTYFSALGRYGGYIIKSRPRTKYAPEELKGLKKTELKELIIKECWDIKRKNEKKKDELIDEILINSRFEEKEIKKMSKDDLVKLAQELNLKFRRGRFWMKAEDASKDHLIKKITIEDGGNRSLDKPRDALTITFKEAVELFQKPPNRRTS